MNSWYNIGIGVAVYFYFMEVGSMKKKVADKVYVQKYDIGFILNELNAVPASIMTSVFDGTSGMFMSVGMEDALSFQCFSGEAADWLMEQDWIIDYDTYYKSTEQQLEDAFNQIQQNFTEQADAFNAKDEKYRAKHYREIMEVKSKAEHQLSSLSIIHQLIQGEIAFSIPA
jgi:hypothetical protein